MTPRKSPAAPAAALSEDERAAKLAEFRRAQASVLLAEHAKRVQRAEKKLHALRQEQTQLLLAGRRAGLSWEDLGAISGVSRQAVQQRVGPLFVPAA